MFCWHCGAQVPDQAQFCPKCGKSLKPGTSQPEQNGDTGQKRNSSPDAWQQFLKKKELAEAKKRLIGVLIGLAVILVVGLGAMLLKPGGGSAGDPRSTPASSPSASPTHSPSPSPTPSSKPAPSDEPSDEPSDAPSGELSGSAVTTGTYTYKSGAVYEGEMRDGLPNGEGVITYSKSVRGTKRYEGQVVDGRWEGRGASWSWDGGAYEGGFKNDLRHGDGIETSPNGTQLAGNWVDGRKEGEFVRTEPDGAQYLEVYENGERISREEVTGSSKPSASPKPSSTGNGTLLAGELAQDPLKYTVTKDSVYIQNPQDYFGGDIDTRGNSFKNGYTTWNFSGSYQTMKDYVEVLCGGGYNLKLVDSYYKSYPGSRISTGSECCAWLLNYTGTGSVSQTTDVTYIDGKRGNIGIYGYSSKAGGALKFTMTIPGDMEQVDLGLRHSGGNVSAGSASGTSTMAGLYRLADGSFQTTDARLTAKLGQAAVLRDGKEYSAPTELVLKANTAELWVKDFYRSELLYLSLPKNGVTAGETHTMQNILKTAWWGSNSAMSTLRDADDFGNYRWALCLGAGHSGEYLLPTYTDKNQFENILVRVLHWEEDKEAVFYIYAAFETSPRVVEALCAVDLTKAVDKTRAPAGTGSGDGDCWYCGGDGRCPTCGGSGTVSKPLIGTGKYVDQNCTDCHSPGKCCICGGDGRR